MKVIIFFRNLFSLILILAVIVSFSAVSVDAAETAEVSIVVYLNEWPAVLPVPDPNVPDPNVPVIIQDPNVVIQDPNVVIQDPNVVILDPNIVILDPNIPVEVDNDAPVEVDNPDIIKKTSSKDWYDELDCFIKSATADYRALANELIDCNCSMDDVHEVVMIVSGPGLDEPKEINLFKYSWPVRYVRYNLELPANVELNFQAEARNEAGEIIFKGSRIITLAPDQNSKLVMALPCVCSRDGNYLPEISLQVNDAWFFPGEEVPIEIVVSDDSNEIDCDVSHDGPMGELLKQGWSVDLDGCSMQINTVLLTDNSSDYNDTITVKVDDGDGGIAEAGISLDIKIPYLFLAQKSICLNETLQLKVEGQGYSYSSDYRDLTNQCSWLSNNNSLITVDPNGLAMGLSGGLANIGFTLGIFEATDDIVVIDLVKLDEGIIATDSIQMVFNPHTKKLNIVFTKFIEDTEGNIQRELWFSSVGVEGTDLSIIGYCYGKSRLYDSPISIAVALDTNQPAVAYWDASHDLSFAQLKDNVWEKELVSTYGGGCSLAFDPTDNNPAIAFNSTGDYNLYYAKKGSSGWNVGNLNWCDAELECLRFHPVTKKRYISYKDWYGYCGRGLHFTGATYGALVDSGDVGEGNCFAFDSLGYPHISYFDGHNNHLKHAYWDGTEWVKEVIDENYGYKTSIVISTDDKIYICYTASGANLKLAYYNGSEWSTEILFYSDHYLVGRWSSLALDDEDKLNIVFIAGGKVLLATDYQPGN
jgi:hypothetical protein